MPSFQVIELSLLAASVVLLLGVLILALIIFLRGSSQRQTLADFREVIRDFSMRFERTEGRFQETDRRLEEGLVRLSNVMAVNNSTQRTEMDEKIGGLQRTLSTHLTSLRDENSKKLDEMRKTVDEQLHETLEKRLHTSFNAMNERLDSVTRSVGEMQTLSTNVSDLKRLFANVKIRGTWGEGALESLISDVLHPSQFEMNKEVVPNSGQRVEFAIRYPAEDGKDFWLPVDAKFPVESYARLIDASQRGNTDEIAAGTKELKTAILHSAKEIKEKYIQEPYSINMGIMFLPNEGLFAEVVRMPGLAQEVFNKYQVVVAGPTTFHTILQALKMGFRSRAAHNKAQEIMELLSAVRTEFGRFGSQFQKVQDRIMAAHNEAERMGTRFKQMDRKLKTVEHASDDDRVRILGADKPGLMIGDE